MIPKVAMKFFKELQKDFVINLLNWCDFFSLGQLLVAFPSLTFGSVSNWSKPFHDVTTGTLTMTKSDIKDKYFAFTRRHETVNIDRH